MTTPITQLNFNTPIKQPLCIALGFFDCLHIGHRTLLDQAKSIAAQTHATVVVKTFTNNPDVNQSPLIYTYPERLSLLQTLNINHVLGFNFDDTFKNVSYKEFLHKLTASFSIVALVCGHDYTFGKDGLGNVQKLQEFCATNNILLKVLPPVEVNGTRVSSTAIKGLLQSGGVMRANSLLATPFYLQGKVIQGFGRGKNLGYPTANVQLSPDKLIPLQGVYATSTTFNGASYPSLTFIGKKPTFNDDSLSVETHIKNYSDNLYGDTLHITFNQFIRANQKFDSSQALIKQIEKDLLF